MGGLALAELAPAEAGGDGIPLAAPPPRRRLALLAVVAASGERGVSREKLLAWFWPEGEEERARHALTQTLYALRRDVGGRELVAGTSTLRLAEAVVRADVAELDAALARGDLAAAVALYRGPFRDGVHLPGLPELERWIEEERARLARRMTDALEAHAAAAERRGDHAAAERWWRALAGLDPMRARYALGLMESLAALGERAAALLTTAYSLDSSSYVLESVAHAAARRGDLRAAERLYATLGARADFGWEGELPRLLAPAERARALERLGDSAAARASWARLVERWPAGDAALAPLAEARRRLGISAPLGRAP